MLRASLQRSRVVTRDKGDSFSDLFVGTTRVPSLRDSEVRAGKRESLGSRASRWQRHHGFRLIRARSPIRLTLQLHRYLSFVHEILHESQQPCDILHFAKQEGPGDTEFCVLLRQPVTAVE